MSASDRIIENIINEIIELSKAKIRLEEPKLREILAAFVIRAEVLRPANGFDIKQDLTKQDVERLINLCVEKLSLKGDASMDTIAMQVYFDSKYPYLVDTVEQEINSAKHQLDQIQQELDEFSPKASADYEVLYRKLVSFILLKSAVGSENDLKDIRETTVALESVFPPSELKSFLNSSRSDKQYNLARWTDLVTGIRLFNRTLGKGGQNIKPIEQNCQQLWSVMDDKIKTLQSKAKPVIQKLERAAVNEQEQYSVIKMQLCFYRQLNVYLDVLQNQLLVSKVKLDKLTEEFNASLNELKRVCRSRGAVPVDQVYPNFIKLSNCWNAWRYELASIDYSTKITDKLIQFQLGLVVDLSTVPEFNKSIDSTPTEGQISTHARSIQTKLQLLNRAAEMVHPENYSQYKSIIGEYNGFCVTTLVDTLGALVLGSLNFGVVKYHDKFYRFADEASLLKFADDPKKYVQGVIDLAKKSPHLIQLLQLYSNFPTIEALEKTRSYGRQILLKKKPMVAEMGTQSDTHIVDKFIDKNYQWNEWELRRRALMLVDLKTKLTHSAQTELSSFKRDSETQHYQLKEKAVQSLRDAKTEMPQVKVILSGLRKDPASKNKFKVINLSF